MVGNPKDLLKKMFCNVFNLFLGGCLGAFWDVFGSICGRYVGVFGTHCCGILEGF